ncbi:XRE family transcriptional regulator [Amycolatopsis sp. NPDC059021]|uniref:XRE family transcriptional regulator n=1 Tax=Amycolatopsis sp. NPDC059021 TaxID=3346704 RepID=UPI00366C4A9D
MRRRAFLVAAGLASTSLATPSAAAQPEPDPAAMLYARLENVLVGPAQSALTPLPLPLPDALITAKDDFHASRYLSLGTQLPQLVSNAEAAAEAAAAASRIALAQVYNLVTRALLKLRASGLEWISADRALRVAMQAGDPLTLAEAQRLMGSVFRRAGHHERAQALVLSAAEQLDTTTPEHLSLHGVLMCSAGYAAARAGDRDRAMSLLDEAAATATRLSGHPARQQVLNANIISHRVSAAYLLGDAGTALQHARAARPADFPSAERHGRFLVDVALAFAQWDKPEQAYRTLLAAERRAPGEVHTRSAARGLISDLMRHRNQPALPGLRHLAIRSHVLG